MTINKKKLLILTYGFPPASFVGVYRTLKYSKYLTRYNWDSIIVTANTKFAKEHNDPHLLNEVPRTTVVYRTYDIDPAKWFYNSKNFAARLIRKLIHNLCNQLCILDSHVFWVPFAVIKSTWILKKEKVDLVYSTSPPHSSHIISLLLKKIFKINYIIDFRDPWGDKAYFTYHRKNILSRYIESSLMKIIVKNATKIITATKGEMTEFSERFPYIEGKKISYITNGFDPDDYEINKQLNAAEKEKQKFIITYIGSVYFGTTDEFFQGLALLKQQNPEFFKLIEVKFVGSDEEHIKSIASDYSVMSIIKFIKYLPHNECLSLLYASDALLIMLGGDNFPSSEIPAKTFEYLYINKPIITIAKKGDLTELVKHCGLGLTIDPMRPKDVCNVLEKLIEAWIKGNSPIAPNHNYINKFKREELTKKLAIILDDACNNTNL
jgi:glycosyltransferase involved in cell wall biosynthesis